MITLKVDPDALGKSRRLTTAIKHDLKFITSLALNATMDGRGPISGSKQRNVRVNLEKSSKQFFDKPTRGVQRGWRLVEKSTKSHLAAGLGYKDRPFETYRYLAPHIFGKKRKPKGAEIALANHPLNKGLPPGSLLVPNRENFKGKLRIDKYGNVPLKTWKYIYDNVGTTQYTERGQPSFLVGRPKYKNRPAGIWWRRKNNEKLWMIFKAVPSASYRPIYKSDKVLRTTVERVWPIYFEKSWNQVINPWLK